MAINEKDHPLSLETLGEGKYQIEWDEAWDHEKLKFKKGNWHWYEMIPCRSGGFIFLYDDKEKLLVISIGKTIGNKILKKVEGAKRKSVDSKGMDIIFPAEALHQVAEIASARRRRRLKPENKANLIEAGKAYRFKGKNHGGQAIKPARKIEPFFDLSKLTAIGQVRVVFSSEAPSENI